MLNSIPAHPEVRNMFNYIFLAVFDVFFRKVKKMKYFWLPGVPESNSASKTVWVHRFKSIFLSKFKNLIFHKVSFFAYNSILESLVWRPRSPKSYVFLRFGGSMAFARLI